MKFSIAMIAGLFLMASASYAGVTIDGTTITFADASVQSTANPPTDHGGTGNSVSGTDSFIGGGYSNLVTNDYNTIGGGLGNDAIGSVSTVSGGESNVASGSLSAIGGGSSNTASGNWSAVGGGRANTASGNYSFVAGGGGTSQGNTASGNRSFVAGNSANDGGFNRVFVWDDGTGSDATAANTFNVNASGGILLNGSVEHSSDRNMKEAFSFVSAREVLDKVVEMPVTTWRFKSEDDSIRHIGPMAQDFMAAFGYGIDDKYITATDADGVALAAIQGLNSKLEDTRRELAAQAEVNTALRWHNAQLEARLAGLENAILRESERAAAGTD